MIFHITNIIKCFHGKLKLWMVIFIFFPFHVLAQKTDTAKIKSVDTVKVRTTDTSKVNLIDTSTVKKHSPQKAMMMSACLPGLGQAYNRKYWKIPIIYIGAATITYFVTFNSKYYNEFKKAYLYRTDGDPTTIDAYANMYATDQLLTLKDYYRRDLELTFIIGGALYALNIIDAAVDAHLYKFDVGDNLSMKINPAFFSFCNHSATGITLSLTFNRNKKAQPLNNY